MKKIGFLSLVLAFLCLTGLFVQCKKDKSCKMKVTCNFSTNGIDTGEVVPKAYIEVGKEGYADFARASGYTNDLGIFEHTFPYPALLDVVAFYSDSIRDADGNVTDIKYYTGNAQIQVNEGETTEKTILLVETTPS